MTTDHNLEEALDLIERIHKANIESVATLEKEGIPLHPSPVAFTFIRECAAILKKHGR